MSEIQKATTCRLAVDVNYSGKWLQMSTVKYIAHDTSEHFWECADRVESRGAVIIIALLKSKSEVILVRQYRPPTDDYVIEFPAGLIDAGETAAATATRELLEETGYRGTVISVSDKTYNSPGMSGEQTVIAIVEIDEDFHNNNPPIPRMEGTEDIETFKVPLDKLSNFIHRAEVAGDGIDSKVMTFALSRGL